MVHQSNICWMLGQIYQLSKLTAHNNAEYDPDGPWIHHSTLCHCCCKPYTCFGEHWQQWIGIHCGSCGPIHHNLGNISLQIIWTIDPSQHTLIASMTQIGHWSIIRYSVPLLLTGTHTHDLGRIGSNSNGLGFIVVVVQSTVLGQILPWIDPSLKTDFCHEPWIASVYNILPQITLFQSPLGLGLWVGQDGTEGERRRRREISWRENLSLSLFSSSNPQCTNEQR